MKKIALVVNYSWAGISSPLINSISYFIEKGYFVDIYLERPDIVRFPIPSFMFDRSNVNIFILNGLGRGLLGDIYFLLFGKWKKRKYNIIIAYDYQATLRGLILKFFSGGYFIYHSLELLEAVNIKTQIYKCREKFSVKYSNYILTQDTIRAKWLSNNLNQPYNKFEIIYNTSRKISFNNIQNDYFKNKFNLKNDVTVILAIGSLIHEHLIYEIAKSATSWSSSKVLVLHGWFPDQDFKNKILGLQSQYSDRIFISEELFDDKNKFIPISSSDIGFVGYSKESLNHFLVGGASGKLFDFLMHGKPILAFDSPGIKTIIDKFNVGLMFDENEFSSLESKIDEIILKKQIFENTCLSSFDYIHFDILYDKFLKKLN